MQKASAASGRSPGGQDSLSLPEQLSGWVERVTFHNDETGFCVLQVKARGHRRPVAVVGHAPRVAMGEGVQATGAWINDPSHGMQFRASRLAAFPPRSEEGLRRYLGSGLLKGVGPSCAARLVEQFGTAVLDVIGNRSEDLVRVPGIGPAKARAIGESWAEHRALRDIAAFLERFGIGGLLPMRLYRLYGAEAIAAISADPYRLVLDLPNVPFVEADRIARSLDIDARAEVRLQAGLAHVLAQAVREGQAGLPRERLLMDASLLLDVPLRDLAPLLDARCATGHLATDGHDGSPYVFPRNLYAAELFIAGRLKGLAGASPSLTGSDKAAQVARAQVARAEAAAGMRYSGSQREALAAACSKRVLVVTGGPGAGKTTLIKGVIHLAREGSRNLVLCAPTGRAARRLSESTGFPATTVHRLLEASENGFRRNAKSPLDCDGIVVDEASMLDIRLMAALLRAMPAHASLLLVGDADQLPSIGPGQVLADIIESGAVPVARLREAFRQERRSRIAAAAGAINRGLVPETAPVPDSDFYFVEAAGAEDGVAKVATLVRERIPRRFGLDPMREVQVLCPMNRGALGTHALNGRLQQILNPPGERGLLRGGWTFGPGDKVMQVRNDYDRDVSNGEVGYVRDVDRADGGLTVAFDERVVAYGADDLDALMLAYAVTIHKAQGSEYPAVVIPVTAAHAPMLGRKLLYTAVTRGSRLVVLVGSREALRQAVAAREEPRWTRLGTWLRAG